MGSEQSAQSSSRNAGGSNGNGGVLSPVLSPTSSRHFDPLLALSRESIANRRQDSVTSDVESSHEVPYVSYTVNRPIGGESPQKKKSTVAHGTSSSGTSRMNFASSLTSGRLMKSVPSTMVVVARGGVNQEELAEDPELARLRDIPSFLPIMRATLSGSGVKDPDILERLDYRGLLSLTQRYEDHLRLCASMVATEQAEINKSIRDVDQKILAVTQVLSEKQKTLAKQSERLSKVGEMSICLNKCHLLLNENIEQMELLNNMLPPEERLEPFVWTTG